MKTLSRFITKFTSLIGAVLSCFDRVIFKGHLALAAPCELERYVDLTLKVRRSERLSGVQLVPRNELRHIKSRRCDRVSLDSPVLPRRIGDREYGVSRDQPSVTFPDSISAEAVSRRWPFSF